MSIKITGYVIRSCSDSIVTGLWAGWLK